MPVLFGVAGLRVVDAEKIADGTVMVWAVIDDPAAAACPECGAVAGPVHETIVAGPRDVRRGSDLVRLCWAKRRRKSGTRTVSRWENQIDAAILTSVSNARSENPNRTATRSQLTSKTQIREDNY